MSREKWIANGILWFTYTLIVIVVLNINVLSLNAVTREYSAVLFNRLFGPSYADPVASGTCPDRVEPGVPCGAAVITLRQETLKTLGTSWPMKFFHHATILEQIRKHDPRAVVVDILFMDEQADRDPEWLTDQIAAYRQADIPIYFAAAGDASLIPALEEELGEGTGADKVLVNMRAGELGGRRAKLAHDYFLTYRAKVPGPNGPAPSAAFEIHNRLVAKPRRLPEIDMAGRADLNLIWGAYPHDLNRMWLRCTQPLGPLTRAKELLVDPAALVQPCPSIPSAPAQALVSKLHPNAFWNDPQRERLIEDRVVFYGSGLVGVSDVIASPTNGKLPGVYTHAMALNNLLSFGSDYKRDRVNLLGGLITLTPQRFEAMLAALLAALTVWGYRPGNAWLNACMQDRRPAQNGERDRANTDDSGTRANERGQEASKSSTTDRDDGHGPAHTRPKTQFLRWAWYVCFVVVSAVLLIGGAWVSYDQLNLYPINWIQLLGLYSVLGMLAKYGAIDQVVHAVVQKLCRYRPDPGTR